ncbi:TPA: hypothetical protein ACGIK9_003295 [Acinetobacter baumannii]|uniref:hypothetical protein n=1 Tax=Acinetobacter baumannii TaxID=470 RepID=UPI00338F061A
MSFYYNHLSQIISIPVGSSIILKNDKKHTLLIKIFEDRDHIVFIHTQNYVLGDSDLNIENFKQINIDYFISKIELGDLYYIAPQLIPLLYKFSNNTTLDLFENKNLPSIELNRSKLKKLNNLYS